MAEFPPTRIIAGTMTGTSIDGLDVALLEVKGTGLKLDARLLHHGQTPLGPLAAPLRALAEQVPARAAEICRLGHDFGRLHADAVTEALEQAGLDRSRLDLVVVHGQTVFHAPPLSWALIDTSPLLERFDCAIQSDLRMNDLARGGEGAPITPLADWVLFRDAVPVSIVNLGGFCNVSHLPGEADGPAGITGSDVCPCNHLLDALSRRTLDEPFDRHGAVASSGVVDEALSGRLAARLVPHAVDHERRSLGTGDEMIRLLEALDGLDRRQDRLATLVDAVARTIASALNRHGTARFFGGGVRNHALQAALHRHLPDAILGFDHPGVPPEAREAAAMSVLGALSLDGIDITLPRVTGSAREDTRRPGRWSLPVETHFTTPE